MSKYADSMGEYVDPSRPLQNAKKERFAALMVAGVDAFEAYGAAGYKPSRKNAWKLAAEPNVKARIEWLKFKATEKIVARMEDAGARAAEAAAEASIDRVNVEKFNRAKLLAMLLRNARIAMGEVPVKITRMVKRRHKGEDGEFKDEHIPVEVEVTCRNGAAANRALELYGKAIGMPFDGSIPHDPNEPTRISRTTPQQMLAVAKKIVADDEEAQELEAQKRTVHK